MFKLARSASKANSKLLAPLLSNASRQQVQGAGLIESRQSEVKSFHTSAQKLGGGNVDYIVRAINVLILRDATYKTEAPYFEF